MTTSTSHDESRGSGASAAHEPGARDRWVVLLVDDEPGVHEITRLVLADASFSGMPVELHSAYSAAEAKAFLANHPDTALMLLDVVMETDDAGLLLVNYVREQIGNADLQIILRTGQPGMAPEREVITRYDINGYFLKTELVAQKLRSIVISSLRAYRYIRTLKPRHGSVAAPEPGASAAYQRLAIEEEFARDLATNELHLLAQPQLHLVSGAVAAIELIPNWRRGDAILGPAQLAEGIRDLEVRQKFDAWLVRQGCGWAQAWRSLGLPPFRISLPILTENICECQVLANVEEELARAAVPHGTLDLEVSEAVLLAERPSARDVVASMRSIGVSVTLVDFGLGLVSLPRLQWLLPDRVKIHKSFVRHVTEDRQRSAIARSIIALAHTLGLAVIADGLVTEQELQFFKWEGCDVGQGDLLARPMAVANVSAALLGDAAPASWTAHLH
jgi:EAL domain-containing protein (putative c-di-GMP-specific phosphodiesterase class I)/DNA-binding NarL/FixJ family response regulator